MFTSLFSRRSIIASLALAAATVVSPALNSAAEAAGNWVLLGTERVGNHPDRDIIHIGRDEGRFEKLMLKVTGNDIHVGDVKVVYANGSSEHLNVQEYVRDGQSTSALDLRGHHRAIERVELLYQADRPRFRQARVHVYGQLSDISSGPPPSPHGWEVLGAQSVGFMVDHDTIAVGADKGRFRTLKLEVKDHDVFVYNARVTFRSGEVQELPIYGLVRGGATTAELDLTGERRMIERVDLVYRSRPGFHGRAHVALLGKH